MDANAQIAKTKRALIQVRTELYDKGEFKAVEAITELLRNEMSVLRLAAILAPKN